jgi:hypothetical protein
MVGKKVIKDNSLKDPKFFSENRNYNLKNELLKQNRIDKDFLEKLRFIKLEELITLKLLVSTESLKGKLFNFPFFKYTNDICKEAIIRFALSIAKNRREASLIIGLKKSDFIKYLRHYNLLEEFKYDSRTKKN